MTASSNRPPSAAQLCARCPNPGIVARRKDHFGKCAWEFECGHARELHVSGAGIVIGCDTLNDACCVDDGQGVFVNARSTLPLRDFFEASLRYLGLK